MQNPLVIGFHARKKVSYAATIESACEFIATHAPYVTPCVAMFVSGPRNSHLNITREIAQQLGARTRGEILFHASYTDIPWSAQSLTDDVFVRVDAIVAACAESRADVVIHCSARVFERAGNELVIERLSESIAKVESVREPRIFIETMSYDARFADPRALNAIFGDAPPRGIGLCVDTAHVWAAGANLATRESCATWLHSIRADIPIAMHLNDSTEPIGTHTDIHTTLGDGEIWALEDGYMSVIEWARERGAPIILERNSDPAEEAARDIATIARKLNQ